ncbi:hypothetical protein BC831DRAFT_463309 [Entophlyctis helioformis]|nr:hypothetical protein BC831DRAFT_463309 [Entophlyctis helioformis]
MMMKAKTAGVPGGGAGGGAAAGPAAYASESAPVPRAGIVGGRHLGVSHLSAAAANNGQAGHGHGQGQPSSATQGSLMAASIGNSGTGGTAKDFGDLDSQLRAGIDLVQDAYTRQAAALKHQVTHWKHVASQHKEQNATLEAQVSVLSRRVAELEHALASQASEKKALVASKAALMDRYNALKKSASQLDAFRKSIVSMVEYSPGAQPLLTSFDGDSRIADAADFQHATPSKPGIGHGADGTDLAALPQNQHWPAHTQQQSASHGSGSGSGTGYAQQSRETLRHSHGDGAHAHSSSGYQQQQQQQQQRFNASTGSRGYEARGQAEESGATSRFLGSHTTSSHHDSGKAAVGDAVIGAEDGRLDAFGSSPYGLQNEVPGGNSTSYFDQQTNTLRSLNISTQALDYSLGSMSAQDKSGLLTVDVLGTLHVKSSATASVANHAAIEDGHTASQQHLNVGHGSTNNQTDKAGPLSASASASTASLNLYPAEDGIAQQQHQHQEQQQQSHTRIGTSRSQTNLVSSSSFSALAPSSAAAAATTVPPTSHTHTHTRAGPSQPFLDRPAADMDAPTLYRHIRDALSATAFEMFATAVAAFNAGRVSATETVKEVHRIVGPGQLTEQMTRLIYEAVRESSSSSSGGGQNPQ